MSYKKKKLKKRKFSQLKYKLGLVKIALLKRVPTLSKRIWSNSKQKEEDRMFQADDVVKILKRYDRMTNNPDFSILKQTVVGQTQKEGFLRLCVFVCPKFNPEALLSETPEKIYADRSWSGLV